jgi:hypothetical protein
MNGQLLACIETAVLRLYHPALGLDPLPGPQTRIVGSVAGRALVRAACFDHDIEAVVHADALHQSQMAYLPHDVRFDRPGLRRLEDRARAGIPLLQAARGATFCRARGS